MKFCINCGAQLTEGAKFCTGCGQRIEQTAAPAAQEPEQPAVHTFAEPEQAAPVQPVSEAVPVTAAPEPAPVQQVEVVQQILQTDAAEEDLNMFFLPVTQNPEPQPAMPVQPAAPVQTEMPVQPAIPVQPAMPVQPAAPQQTFVPQQTYIPVQNFAPAKPAQKKKSPNRLVFLLAGVGVLAILLVVLLISCIAGGSDPNLGLYNGVSYTHDGMEMSAAEEWVELKSGGKLEMSLMGDEFSGKWEVDGEDLTVIQAGDSYYGTLKEGVLILDLDGWVFTYVNKDYKAPENGKESSKDPGAAGYWTLLRCEDDGDMAMDEETVEMLRSLGMEIYLDLKADGTGEFMIEDAPFEVTWNKKTIRDDEGYEYSYKLKDGQLHLDVEGAVMIFVPGERDGSSAAAPGGDQVDAGELDPMLAFWEGDWYGWWVVWTGSGSFASMEDSAWDAYAHIDVNPDYTGTVTLWEVDSSREEPLAVVEVSFRSGVSEYGCMVSESGWFMDCEVAHADWNVDVGASMVRMFDNMIAIDSYYYEPANSDNSFNYVFILRPWGMDWEDVRGIEAEGTYYSDMMPMEYDTWYLPLIEKGVSVMPDSHQEGQDQIG